ncbi:MAG: hypothetical protein GXO64_03835, partial [Candidatus Micrarchaeota archaeon]|nr:hypothetical protein [Candidatus Micrarchaeota archaeon]
AFSMLAVGTVLWHFFGIDMLIGMLLGAILGGTSFPVVESIIKSAKIKESVRSILSIESIITDPIVIVIAIALMDMMTSAAVSNSSSAVQSVLSAFSTGAVVGLFAGIIWLYMLRILKGKPFDYMLTLGVLFLLYVFVEMSAGSGAIASLVFGLVLGNGKTFRSIFRIKKHLDFDENMRRFQSEVSFLMKSFFFVLLGIMVVIKGEFVLYGLLTAAILIILRLFIAWIGSRNMKLDAIDKNIMRVTVPRGLAAAVLAQYPLTYNIPHADMISSIVFVVILVTATYATIAVRLVAFFDSRKKNHNNKEKKTKDEKRIDDIVSFVKK